MKKILFLLIAILASVNIANARAYNLGHYTATSFSIRTIAYDYYGNAYWTDWSRDYSCNIDIYFNSVPQIIITSNKTQIYNVIDATDEYYDSKGFLCYDFKVIDQDGDYGTVIMRSNNYFSQIYIKFANIMWVYEVK